MSILNHTLPSAQFYFTALYRTYLLQVEAENGGLTWWGALLILGLVILLVVLAFAWNASKTRPPHVEHPAVEGLEDVTHPGTVAHEVVEVPEAVGPEAVWIEESVEPVPALVPEPEQPPIPEVEVVEPSPAAALAADDLAVIEGIGPRIASLLQENGITTFDQLAHADLDELRSILQRADLRIADPGTWREQAELAARGDWAGLQELQDRLKGGRM